MDAIVSLKISYVDRAWGNVEKRYIVELEYLIFHSQGTNRLVQAREAFISLNESIEFSKSILSEAHDVIKQNPPR